MAGLARDAAPGTVLLSGGEATVTVTGAGRGGPNAEYALALALALDGAPGIFATACDTDGIDGTEDNAGALVMPDTLARAGEAGEDAAARLAANDAYGFFARNRRPGDDRADAHQRERLPRHPGSAVDRRLRLADIGGGHTAGARVVRRHRSAKIVATLGPSSADEATVRALFETGVDVFRLNFSHASHAEHRARHALVRAVEDAVGRPIGILADLQGPKLRIGTFQ